MRRLLILHPLFFALAPILFVASVNQGAVSWPSVRVPLVVALVVAFLIFMLLGTALRNILKASILVSSFLILFFAYGHVYELVRYITIAGVEVGRHRILTPLWFLLLLGIAFVTVRARSDLINATKVFFVVGVVMLTLPLLQLSAHFLLMAGGRTLPNGGAPLVHDGAQEVEVGSKPDIYFIIPDSYAGQDALRDIYGYDNGEFVNALEARGFSIARRSTSNYASTVVSLPATLNMEYVNYFTELIGADSKDPSLPDQLVSNSKVLDFFKGQGYTFINFCSGADPTDFMRRADLNIQCGRINEFTSILLGTSMLNPFVVKFLHQHRHRILCTFERLGEIAGIKGPKFVLAHMAIPHFPIVFGPNGEKYDEVSFNLHGDDVLEDRKGKFIGQLIYTNKRLLSLVDSILAKSAEEPIIIIQADHGPMMSAIGEAWKEPTREMIREKHSILNAMYLPYGTMAAFYDTITPVNTFRVILSAYFGQDFGLLEDRNYYSYDFTPYNFTDITDVLH